jgi:hypothetical protein
MSIDWKVISMTDNGLDMLYDNAAEIQVSSVYVKKDGNGSKSCTDSIAGAGDSVAGNNNGFLRGLDGIRAIACLGVIFHHFAQKLSPQIRPAFIREIGSFLLMGNSGVSVFFVLSGFLLS